MRAFITGGEGFVGRYLVRELLKLGYEVHSTCKERCEFDDAIYHPCDVTCKKAVRDLVLDIAPDVIFHLAGITFVPVSFQDSWNVFEVNAKGTLNVLEAALSLKTLRSVIVVGSADEYGLVPADRLPIKEDFPVRPLSPYAVSKAAVDMLAYQYFFVHKLPVIRVRPFNHTGPGQSSRFICSAFARQIVRIEKGKQPPVVLVGNLEAVRDFTDVRDVVRAYVMLARRGTYGDVYNICSGKGYKISDILDILFEVSGVSADVEVNKDRLRPVDVPVMIGSYEKLKRDTGWTPVFDIRQTLKDMLDYWRSLE